MKNEISSVNRRSFIKRSLGGMVGLALSSGASLTRAAGRLPVREKSGEVIKRTLGKTGLKLPVVSMGVMNADNPGVVQAALDSGIVMLDTAYSYQRGRNEEMIGRIVNNRPRDSFVIVTKVPGWPWDKTTGLFNQETKGEDFLKRFDLSLRRLGLDHVDILYLHDVNKRENVLFEPILDALQTTKQSGKARFIGVSTHKNQSEVIHAAIESKTYDVVLSSYNFRQDYSEKTAEAMAEATASGLGVVAMKTQAGVYWDKDKQDKINMKAALKWALNNPHVTTAIPGFKTYDQLAENVEVMTDINLTEQEWKDLRMDSARTGSYCQQCQICLSQCSRNLPIPDLMRGHMYAHCYRNLDAAHDLLLSLDVGENPCCGCGVCSVRCAKGLNVRDRVKDIVRLRLAGPGSFPG